MLSYELPLEASHRGAKAILALKTVNHRGVDAGFSNRAAVEIADLPEPPSDLQATLTEHAVELRWNPSAQSAFGGAAPAVDEYEVYRSEAGATGPARLLAATTDPSYDDRTFTFGTRYIYAIRAAARSGSSVARTPESNRVEVAAVDTFPPAAPQSLRVIPVRGAAELAWSPNTEADLGGYNLYRSDGGDFIRLNAELLGVPLYRDASRQPSVEYQYRVTAVDHSGNEGPPSQVVAARDGLDPASGM
jgi:fibronectin type 3 domain-containing protein